MMTSPATLITEHLDTWTSAIKAKSSAGRGSGKKQEFYGIKKLRNLILELAVRGLLTHSERTWTKASFGDIFDIHGGTQPPKSQFIFEPRTGYVRLLQIRDLGETPVPTFIPEDSARRFCDESDILIGRYGASVGKIFKGQKGAYNVALAKLVWSAETFAQDFLITWLKSDSFQSRLAGASRSAQAGFNKGDLASIQIKFPPLAEQHRIVAKVDELMALCDQLELRQEDSVRTHGTLVETLLGALTAASERGQFDEAWKRIASHFDSLFTTDSSIDQLKQTLLQLAVMGKLVEQDPEDEPVEKSISRAKKEAQLSARDSVSNVFIEAPFDLPRSWTWITVADVARSRLGKMLDKGKNRGDAHPYLRNTNVHWFRFELDSIKTMLFSPSEVDEYLLEIGDVLICEGGHGIARSAVWEGQIPGITFQKALHRVRPLSCLTGYFLTFCLRVYEHEGILQRYYTGAGIPHFTGRALAKVTIPLPPLAEQHRIVAKVDELMTLCDRLKASLQTAQATQLHLADSLVETAADGRLEEIGTEETE